MKSIALQILLGGAILIGASGCEVLDTPAYTAQERGQLIGRNWGFEFQQAMDDIDYGFLLRPAGHLTPWNVQ